ncbi:MAG: A/G-specific adenine glycosylase [Acidobacteria bacterium]|nr:MAG: A/G-specific adenine glycosylase [Acidobacteriota bacterium]
MIKFSVEDKEWLTQKLLAWYFEHHRKLPWRQNKDPYRVLVSEIMCQQTQVQTVIPYFNRFMEAFPDLTSLAHAPMERLLKLWEGLGYYRRARLLKQCAEYVVRENGGKLGETKQELIKLPGIGAYTSAAIASIAFGEPVGVVDGNVYRVYSRFFNLDWDISLTASRKCYQALADEAVSDQHPGDYNQAVMELGARVCTPNKPACSCCPVADHCRVYVQNLDPATRPIKTKKVKVRKETIKCLWSEKGDSLLIVQRPDSGMLQGLWELPSSAMGQSDLLKMAPRAQVKVSHKYSHIDALYEVYLPEDSETIIDDSALNWNSAWIRKNERHPYALTGAMKKILKTMDWYQEE